MKLEQALAAFDRAARGSACWNSALTDFAALTGVGAGLLCVIDRQGALIAYACGGMSPDDAADYLASGGADPRANPRIRTALRAPLLKTIVENELATPQIVRRRSSHTGFLARHDLPHCTLTKLADDGQKIIVLLLMRSSAAGPSSDTQRRLIDRAAPRIRDAAIAGLARERQQIDLVCNTLDYLTTAVLALNAQGHIVILSPLAVAVLDDGRHLQARSGALLTHAPERQRALTDAITATCRTTAPDLRRGTSLMLPADDGGAPLIAEIAPLPLETDTWLHTACCLVFLRSQAIARVDIARYLTHHHLLTPSECDIALHLVEGRDARGIATLRAVSEGTVRNQIKAVLAKTGHRRQIDLVTALRH